MLREELSRTTFEMRSGILVENGCKIALSRDAALTYETKRNDEIKLDMEARGLIYDPHIHCCIGGIGISAGVTDFDYNNSRLTEENISPTFAALEQQCERVMGWAKKLDVLGIGATKAKNAVGIAIVDDK